MTIFNLQRVLKHCLNNCNLQRKYSFGKKRKIGKNSERKIILRIFIKMNWVFEQIVTWTFLVNFFKSVNCVIG